MSQPSLDDLARSRIILLGALMMAVFAGRDEEMVGWEPYIESLPDHLRQYNAALNPFIRKLHLLRRAHEPVTYFKLSAHASHEALSRIAEGMILKLWLVAQEPGTQITFPGFPGAPGAFEAVTFKIGKNRHVVQQYLSGLYQDDTEWGRLHIALEMEQSALADAHAEKLFGKEADGNAPDIVSVQQAQPAESRTLEIAKPITKEAFAVLCYLSKRHPVLSTLDDIEEGAKVSRSKAKTATDELISAGYAERPHGPNKGVSSTHVGLAVANKLSTKSEQT